MTPEEDPDPSPADAADAGREPRRACQVPDAGSGRPTNVYYRLNAPRQVYVYSNDDSCGEDTLGDDLLCRDGFDDEWDDVCEAPLRIVHVGPSLVRAGIELWLKGLSRFLDPRRVRLVNCVVTIPDECDRRLAAELPVEVILGGRDAVRKAARECDVLMFWGPPELGEWLADCRPRLGIFVAHGEGEFTRAFLKGCEPVIDHVVAVSRRVSQRVCDDFPTTIITNGIDTAHLSRSLPRNEARARLGFEPADFVLGYVGRFSPEKRPETVIAAAACLPRHFKVLLVGWGWLQDRLLEMANRLIPGRFAITEGTRGMGDYYQSMDALCMVSSEEGYSLALLEAMMSGLPVIATDVGCVPELITDRVSGLVVSGTPESVRDAALLLEKHPTWAGGMAAEGMKIADQVGHARQMARKYEHLIHKLWVAKFGARTRGDGA